MWCPTLEVQPLHLLFSQMDATAHLMKVVSMLVAAGAFSSPARPATPLVIRSDQEDFNEMYDLAHELPDLISCEGSADGSKKFYLSEHAVTRLEMVNMRWGSSSALCVACGAARCPRHDPVRADLALGVKLSCFRIRRS